MWSLKSMKWFELMRKLILGIADGNVYCDNVKVFEANDIRVGLFKS